MDEPRWKRRLLQRLDGLTPNSGQIGAKRVRVKEGPVEAFVMQIESWEWDYSFGVGPDWQTKQWRSTEGRNVKFRGILQRPNRFRGKVVQLTLMPNKAIDESDPSSAPSGIGHLWRTRPVWTPQVSIPASALTPLLVVADKFRFALFEATAEGDIRNFTLQMTIDDEQLGGV